MGEYRMLSEGERIEEGVEHTSDPAGLGGWIDTYSWGFMRDRPVSDFPQFKFRRPLRPSPPAAGGKPAMAPCWCGTPYGNHGPYVRCPHEPPAAPAPKPAPLTEERIAALTYERDRTASTPRVVLLPDVAPGRGLIHEDIRRVCPTCQRDVPAYLARCKCGALDKPIYRLREARRGE